jgi:hypothetical protein
MQRKVQRVTLDQKPVDPDVIGETSHPARHRGDAPNEPIRFRRLRTIWAMTPVIATTVVLSLIGMCLVRRYAPPELLRASNDVVGNYLQTLGTVYAVLLAFVVYVVWGEFNDARLQCEREANEIVDLYRTAKGLPDAVREVLQGHLRRYTEQVIAHEWTAMAKGDAETIERVGRILDDTWNSFQAFEPANGYEEALSHFNDLSDLRMTRLVCARLRIPFAMRLLLYLGAFMVIGSMWLFHLESFTMHAIITGCMAFALSHVLYLVWDLDQCFAGDWQVSRAPFRRARRYMDESTLAS